jgi:predicted secreted protein
MKKIYLLLFVTILSIGCLTLSPTAEPTPEPARKTVATTDPNQSIEVQTGGTFDIFIDSNPTTGYHWEIVGEMDGVEFVSRDYVADEPVKPGSGGVDVWTFKAVSVGQAQITLGSYPPGVDAESGEPEQTVAFNIIVK